MDRQCNGNWQRQRTEHWQETWNSKRIPCATNHRAHLVYWTIPKDCCNGRRFQKLTWHHVWVPEGREWSTKKREVSQRASLHVRASLQVRAIHKVHWPKHQKHLRTFSLFMSCNKTAPIKALLVQGHMTSIGLKLCMPPYAISNNLLLVTLIVAVEGATFVQTVWDSARCTMAWEKRAEENKTMQQPRWEDRTRPTRATDHTVNCYSPSNVAYVSRGRNWVLAGVQFHPPCSTCARLRFQLVSSNLVLILGAKKKKMSG